MTETFYDVLGVAEDATTEEIESAYREAIKQVHPDVSDDVDASERTARLNKAKDVLTDTDERARYDRLGHDTYTSGATPSGGETTASGQSEAATSPGKSSGETDGRDGGEAAGHTDRRNRRRRNHRDRDRERRRRERRSNRAQSTGATSGDSTTNSSASQRQAAASADGDARASSSWNAWDTSRAWAVRQDTGSERGLGLGSVSLSEQSIILLGSTFFLYPFFVVSTMLPIFPLVARLAIGVCTLLTIMYLLSIPEAAMVIFGLWSVLTLFGLLLIPALSLFSVVGFVALVATWVPFGFSVLTFFIVRPM